MSCGPHDPRRGKATGSENTSRKEHMEHSGKAGAPGIRPRAMKSVSVAAALILILAGCSSSGTIGASGENSGTDNSGAIGGAAGGGGSGGASGGSLAGGVGKVEGVDI